MSTYVTGRSAIKRTASHICTFLILISMQYGVWFLFPSSLQAALTDTPVDWSNFSFVPYLSGGQPIYDYEGPKDPTNGGTAVQPDEIDYSSCSSNGYFPGNQPSVQIAYYDADSDYSTVNDAHVAFRLRLNGNPVEGGQQKGYRSGNWYVLIDIDNDDYKEFAIDLDGAVYSQNPDRLYLLYNNNNSNILNARTDAQRQASDVLGGDEIGIWYASGPGAGGIEQVNNHTRVSPAAGACSGGTEYWLDIQLPMAAFNVGGNQLLAPSIPAKFFFSSSASVTDPLQKDWCSTAFGDKWSPHVIATKRASLFNDVDSDSMPGPGDTLLYTIDITNNGLFNSDNVTYHDVITDSNLILSDNVTTTQGSIVKGNNPADTEVEVGLGQLNSGSAATVTFRAKIVDPLPAGVTYVENQGLISCCSSQTPTDDPDTAQPGDPTRTTVTASPAIHACKCFDLVNDPDLNGIPSPGDKLRYRVIIQNNGNQDASGSVFHDVPPLYTHLVVGSTTTTSGTIVKGNNASDTYVEINIGSIPGNHSTVTITFDITIDSPLPDGITTLCNQGLISGTNFASEPTDNPFTEEIDDRTCTAITAQPMMEVYKHQLLTDEHSPADGQASPGDTITYTVFIKNLGNQNATGVTFTDTPDTNTTLITGSVNVSQGIVLSGNGSGDASVIVNVGTIPANPHAEITISFKVTINDPLIPPGTSVISNQGIVSGSNFPDEPTDDPETITDDDPTEIYIVTPENPTGTPDLHITKTDIIENDPDGNQAASAGDVLTYNITVLNNGNAPAANISLNDVPDPNTSLLTGSVSTDQGNIISGNNPQDSTVQVDIGVIGPKQKVAISFSVIIGTGSFTQVKNQGVVTGDSINTTLSDDSDTPAPHDETITPISIFQQPSADVTAPSDSSGASSSAPVINAANCTRPELCVTYLRAQPAKVSANQPVIVMGNVCNRGDAECDYTATLKINGEIDQEKKGNLPANKAVPIQFEIRRWEPGVYQVDLNGQLTYFTVESIESGKNTSHIKNSILAGILLLMGGCCVIIIYRRLPH